MISKCKICILFFIINFLITSYCFAATGEKTQEDAVAWANSLIGKTVDYNSDGNYEATDLIQQYYQYLGQTPYQGLANEYSTNPKVLPSGWTYVDTPSLGDIVTWIDTSGGHLAIITNIADNRLFTVEQNFNKDAYVKSKARAMSEVNASKYIHPDFYIPKPKVEISFNRATNASIVYIYPTDACFGHRITCKNGTIQEAGLLLFDNNDKKIGEKVNKSFKSSDFMYVHINSDVHVLLVPNASYSYQFYAIVDGVTYYGEKIPFKTPENIVPEVEFNDWYQEGYTYVTETDAAIGQTINVKVGSCNETGIYLYSQNDELLAKAKNSFYNKGKQVCFWINRELNYTLTPNTTYKYRFYAMVNGQQIFSEYKSFKTLGIPEPIIEEPPVENPIEEVEIIPEPIEEEPIEEPIEEVIDENSLHIITTGLENAYVNRSYSQKLEASETKSVKWSISGGSLPNGLSLSSSGKISGSPKNDGEYTFTITIKNSDETFSRQYMILVIDASKKKDVHFTKVNTFKSKTFTDIENKDWYYNYAKSAYEFGLMKGNGENQFLPSGSVTIAEAATMACRLRSTILKDKEKFESDGGTWYQVYLDYAFKNGIMDYELYTTNPNRPAKRNEFAEMFANAFPEVNLYPINRVPDNAIPDVKVTDKYAPSVYKLYKAGILAGSDERGTFNPKSNITRAEAATILSRMAESKNRLATIKL